MIDIFFFFELLINFNSAYTDENKEIIDNRKMIAMRYLSGWFFIDLISILPLDIILLSFVEESNKNDA